MIVQNNPTISTVVQNNLSPAKDSFLHIIKRAENDYQISKGYVPDPSVFLPTHTVRISPQSPQILWNLLHELMDLPIPPLLPPKTETLPIKADPSDIESLLKTMSSKDIVKKVLEEKGVQITNSLKSKATIIKKVVKLYNC